MKKLFSVLVVGLLLIAFACGGGGKYADLKNVFEDYIDATEKFFDGFEKADNADKVAAAINDYSDAVKKIIPKMKEMQKKYPDLGKEKDVPEELKATMERFQKVMAKMPTLFGKVAQYGTDPKVQEAQKKLMEVMAELR
ncbi:MAG: hypothetical protein GTO45_05900 [Candidatus Aminicenantes bacterium]|nr:hypothetical protein [Candidatus Aminicenantes bacterium]NIM84783.1 hypothetical protein [Candidatus Aminicenantes bacterium]NIN17618.1 hypothetical protein [Candidatus Aminicenantes bacterium]NIN41496.1 hypothetical protein [Candidatus Aminicenantes bacterium]NIN84270.1 hypothetical protein [Candidatus Aminicenantes bacterium]